MLEAVGVVHEKERIVHGDIKPHNFVLVKGFLKLIDFGIAKTLEQNTTNIGRDNLVLLLPSYSVSLLFAGGNLKLSSTRNSQILTTKTKQIRSSL